MDNIVNVEFFVVLHLHIETIVSWIHLIHWSVGIKNANCWGSRYLEKRKNKSGGLIPKQRKIIRFWFDLTRVWKTFSEHFGGCNFYAPCHSLSLYLRHGFYCEWNKPKRNRIKNPTLRLILIPVLVLLPFCSKPLQKIPWTTLHLISVTRLVSTIDSSNLNKWRPTLDIIGQFFPCWSKSEKVKCCLLGVSS